MLSSVNVAVSADTAEVIPVPPAIVRVSVPISIVSEPLSPATVITVNGEVVETAVTRPFEFTVTTGIAVPLPYAPAVTPLFASVAVALTLAAPVTLVSVAVTSPVKDKSRPFCHALAVEALPITAPVCVPAESPVKSPVTSPVTLPVKLPVTLPVIVLEALTVVNEPAAGVLAPIIPSRLPVTSPVKLPVTLPVTFPVSADVTPPNETASVVPTD